MTKILQEMVDFVPRPDKIYLTFVHYATEAFPENFRSNKIDGEMFEMKLLY